MRHPARLTAAGVAAAAVVAGVVAYAENPPRPEPYQAMRAIADRLDEEIPSEGATRVVTSNSNATIALGSELEVGIVYWLRRTGQGVVARPQVAERLTPAYAKGDYERKLGLFVDVPPSGGRVIARLPVSDPIDRSVRIVTVTVAPERGVAR